VAIEARKGRLYWYDRRKSGDRWRKVYLGPVSAEHAALYRNRGAPAANEPSAGQIATAEAKGVLAAGAEFDRLSDQVFRAVMHLAGYRCHHRGDWRKQQGFKPMVTLQDILGAFGPKQPLPGLIKPASNNPAHKETLARAAAGDYSVLPAVRELLKDPCWLTTYGSVLNMATAALVTRAAGDDVLMQEAVMQKLSEQRENLLAEDSKPVPRPVCMAATRVSHCWLAVHILEALTARHTAGSAAALGVERQLAIAERRLAVAMKSLVTLRRLNRPVVKQLNVANGPMQVNNQFTSGSHAS